MPVLLEHRDVEQPIAVDEVDDGVAAAPGPTYVVERERADLLRAGPAGAHGLELGLVDLAAPRLGDLAVGVDVSRLTGPDGDEDARVGHRALGVQQFTAQQQPSRLVQPEPGSDGAV